MTTAYAFGMGIGTKNINGEWLEVYYQKPELNPNSELIQVFTNFFNYSGGNQYFEPNTSELNKLANLLKENKFNDTAELTLKLSESDAPITVTILETDSAPASTPEAYLKLHLLSHRLVKPHGTNLTGIFGLLPNVAWTNEGAIDLKELSERQLSARLSHKTLEVFCIDKFPKMTNYVVPSGVRIADTSRIRLGAYVGEGTTVMHEGFINFNAGTEGPGMIEGRISAGVYVGKNSDLGGGCSTMGTLSGGGNIVISVGEGCLIGANAGIGIPLGDRCTVESGLYVTAGTKVIIFDDQGNKLQEIKARELANKSDLLFRRNSINGAVECITNKSAIELNQELHINN